MRIPRRLLEGILAHCRRSYPLEGCGVLLGRTDGPGGVQVEEVAEVANREREQPRVRFQIAPEDLMRLQREGRARGREIVGYYHSHPDHPARPSETDRRIAAEGLSDGVIHMVVSVRGGRETEAGAWIFRDAAQDFEPEPLDVDP